LHTGERGTLKLVGALYLHGRAMSMLADRLISCLAGVRGGDVRDVQGGAGPPTLPDVLLHGQVWQKVR
jgi:hypothetical protein